MKLIKILQMAGLMLLVGGMVLTVFDIFTGDGEVLVTSSKGFYLFICGLLLTVASKRLSKK